MKTVFAAFYGPYYNTGEYELFICPTFVLRAMHKRWAIGTWPQRIKIQGSLTEPDRKLGKFRKIVYNGCQYATHIPRNRRAHWHFLFPELRKQIDQMVTESLKTEELLTRGSLTIWYRITKA